MRKHELFWRAFASLCLCVSLTLHADTLTGEARGSVLDTESRNTLPDVSMTLLSVDRGWTKRGTTDADGNYVFIQLEPGNYTVAAEKEGYYRAERTDILVRLNQPKVVVPPFELRRLVSTPTQQITVTQGEVSKNVVVDLTSSGATLKANGLVEVEEIARVTSRLAVNRTALKTRTEELQGWIERFREAVDAGPAR